MPPSLKHTRRIFDQSKVWFQDGSISAKTRTRICRASNSTESFSLIVLRRRAYHCLRLLSMPVAVTAIYQLAIETLRDTWGLILPGPQVAANTHVHLCDEVPLFDEPPLSCPTAARVSTFDSILPVVTSRNRAAKEAAHVDFVYGGAFPSRHVERQATPSKQRIRSRRDQDNRVPARKSLSPTRSTPCAF
jgi:hypothetical protein